MYNYKKTGVDIEKADEIIKNISSKFNMDNLENFDEIFLIISSAFSISTPVFL